MTQWAVTQPVVDPADTPPQATDPLSFSPLFKLRDVGLRESFEGIVSLQDLVAYSQNELTMFEPYGPGGNVALQDSISGDSLTIGNSRLDYWLQDSVPYTDRVFTISGLSVRRQGTLPQVFAGNKLQLPGYIFTPADIGRWVLLSGFVTSGYNGFAMISGYDGGTATVVGPTIMGTETGGAWSFRRLQITTVVGMGNEPRYFPSKVYNEPWVITRGGVIASGLSGSTARQLEEEVSRSQRVTTLEPSLAAAQDLMAATRDGVLRLQRAASTNDTSFTVVITTTFGP